MKNEPLDIRPLTGALGAEIFGLDLSQPLDDATFAQIHKAFLDHLVIFFRDQTLSPANLVAFAKRFGPMDPHPFLKGMAEQPEVLEIIREKTDKHIFAPGWHADVTWKERPVLGSMLYALEVPETGGDTLFANQYMAYDALSEGMKTMLGRVRARHSGSYVYGGDEPERGTYVHKLKVDRTVAARAEAFHPIVRTHPETKRKCIFVNPGWTLGLEDMNDDEAGPLLEFLFDHTVRPEFTCRFRWQPGSLAFWDNRCTQHSPIDDYFGKRRHLLRVTIEGDRPV